MSKKVTKSAFTVDVECGLSLAMRDSYGIDMNPTDRVLIHTGRILDLLENREIKGTFFILGIVAEHYPGLIKRIAAEGHELGVHGYHHYEFNKMDRKQAFRELDRAKKLIEDVSGQNVYGHRAPAFSINQDTRWGLDVIAEAGFEYDSSVMPIRSLRYGWPEFGSRIRAVETSCGKSLIEAPITPSRILFMELPASGGRYFQILPYVYLKHKMERIIKSHPFIFYIHPYEIDTAEYPGYYQEQLKKAGLKKKIRTSIRRLNRKHTFNKLERLTSDFDFAPLYQIIKKSTTESTA